MVCSGLQGVTNFRPKKTANWPFFWVDICDIVRIRKAVRWPHSHTPKNLNFTPTLSSYLTAPCAGYTYDKHNRPANAVTSAIAPGSCAAWKRARKMHAFGDVLSVLLAGEPARRCRVRRGVRPAWRAGHAAHCRDPSKVWDRTAGAAWGLSKEGIADSGGSPPPSLSAIPKLSLPANASPRSASACAAGAPLWPYPVQRQQLLALTPCQLLQPPIAGPGDRSCCRVADGAGQVASCGSVCSDCMYTVLLTCHAWKSRT